MTDQQADLYKLYFSAATPHEASTWNVFGEGFGLRCFPTKEQAIEAAEAYFGTAKFTLRIWPDRTQLHSQAAPGTAPANLLDQAIAALVAERDALRNCPVHRKAASGQ